MLQFLSWSDCRYNKHISHALIWSITGKTLQNTSLSPCQPTTLSAPLQVQLSNQALQIFTNTLFLTFAFDSIMQKCQYLTCTTSSPLTMPKWGSNCLVLQLGAAPKCISPRFVYSSLSLGRLTSAQSCVSSGSVLLQSQLNATRCHCVAKMLGNTIRVCPVINTQP